MQRPSQHYVRRFSSHEVIGGFGFTPSSGNISHTFLSHSTAVQLCLFHAHICGHKLGRWIFSQSGRLVDKALQIGRSLDQVAFKLRALFRDVIFDFADRLGIGRNIGFSKSDGKSKPCFDGTFFTRTFRMSRETPSCIPRYVDYMKLQGVQRPHSPAIPSLS